MPAVPLPARLTACSTIDAMPCRSMSFIVKTWTCESRTATFSRASRLRMPMRTVCAACTFGEKLPIFDSSAGSGPSSAASGMPCTLPDSEVAAVHDRHRAFVERGERGLIHLLTDLGDIADVFLPLVAQLLCLGDRRRKV